MEVSVNFFNKIKRILKNFYFAKNFPFQLKREISLFNAKAQVDTHHKGIADVIYNKNFGSINISVGMLK